MSKIYLILAFTLIIGTYRSSGEEIASYDRMKTVFISQLFRAVKQKNYVVALEKLDRLRELSTSSVTLGNLRYELQKNIAIEKARIVLHQGSYPTALKVLDDAVVGNPQGDGLASAYNTIQGLVLMKTYLEGIPYPGSEEMQHAFSKLPIPNLFAGSSNFYKSWYKEQKNRLETLIHQEKKRLLRELIDELDVALSTSSENQWLLVIQLVLLLKDEDMPMSQLDTLIRGFDTSDFASSYTDLTNELKITDKSLLSGEENRLIDLILYSIYQKGKKEKKRIIPASLDTRKLSTISGVILRIENSFTMGNFFTALGDFTRLFRLLHQFDGRGIYNGILNKYLKNDLAPTSPSLHSVLFHLYYVQEFE